MIEALDVYYQTGIYSELDENGDETDFGIPEEILCLEMANNDPLRAKEIFENLSQYWFEWYLVQRSAIVKSQRNKK